MDSQLQKETLVQLAERWSCNKHREVNQFYGDHPYEYHLRAVVNVAKKYIELLPKKDRDLAIAACWAHDTIEDTRQTYNDVKRVLGWKVAEVVYNVTQEKGKTRDERESPSYFDGIARCHVSTFVKFCDRIANMQESWDNRSSMYRKYRGSLPYFLHRLDIYPDFEPMSLHLQAFLGRNGDPDVQW